MLTGGRGQTPGPADLDLDPACRAAVDPAVEPAPDGALDVHLVARLPPPDGPLGSSRPGDAVDRVDPLLRPGGPDRRARRGSRSMTTRVVMIVSPLGSRRSSAGTDTRPHSTTSLRTDRGVPLRIHGHVCHRSTS